MPIWFELLVLLLVTYVVGIGIGWSLWGREIEASAEITDMKESPSDG